MGKFEDAADAFATIEDTGKYSLYTGLAALAAGLADLKRTVDQIKAKVNTIERNQP